jgi:hypothetical protein
MVIILILGFLAIRLMGLKTVLALVAALSLLSGGCSDRNDCNCGPGHRCSIGCRCGGAHEAGDEIQADHAGLSPNGLPVPDERDVIGAEPGEELSHERGW